MGRPRQALNVSLSLHTLCIRLEEIPLDPAPPNEGENRQSHFPGEADQAAIGLSYL
jgi:hypothetical protein